MPGEQYKGKLEHIMEVCSKAGFAGVEPETSFMQHLEDPILMKEVLDKYQLDLAVLCVVEDWLGKKESSAERERADKWINFLQHFPDTILLTVQMPQKDRSNLRERQDNMISCVNAFSQRASDQGITCSNHPNSPGGSVFRTAEDYEILLEGLDPRYVGYCPDAGHIAKGGMNPLEIIQKYRDRVNLVHYKDMYTDGRWAATGQGYIDFAAITKELVNTGYEGWIVMEDECDRAITEPDQLTLEDGIYIDQHIRPILE